MSYEDRYTLSLGGVNSHSRCPMPYAALYKANSTPKLAARTGLEGIASVKTRLSKLVSTESEHIYDIHVYKRVRLLFEL